MTTISFVVAHDRDRVIGKDGTLPWRAPADMRWFRRVTRGKPVVMGRRTYDSIGRPLPERTNIVLSRDPAFRPDGVLVARSVDEALDLARDAPEIMVIGGGTLFAALLSRADRLYLTEIDAEFPGDTYFPPIDPARWREVERTEHAPEEGDPLRYSFVVLDRIP